MTSVTSFHWDNSEYQQDSSVQMGIPFGFFITEVNRQHNPRRTRNNAQWQARSLWDGDCHQHSPVMTPPRDNESPQGQPWLQPRLVYCSTGTSSRTGLTTQLHRSRKHGQVSVTSLRNTAGYLHVLLLYLHLFIHIGAVATPPLARHRGAGRQMELPGMLLQGEPRISLFLSRHQAFGYELIKNTDFRLLSLGFTSAPMSHPKPQLHHGPHRQFCKCQNTQREGLGVQALLRRMTMLEPRSRYLSCSTKHLFPRCLIRMPTPFLPRSVWRRSGRCMSPVP